MTENLSANDTIAAIATANGKGGIGIVRISGNRAKEIGEKIAGKALVARHAHYCEFTDHNKNPIDQGIALLFPSPHSFTGEDVVELQAHGSQLLLDQLLSEVLSCGARLARPGEFSERAFLNDKIDLVQAEAIADIIESASTTASHSALKTLQGDFSEKINRLVEDVTRLRVYVEAAIDFPEEEIDFISDPTIARSLEKLIESVRSVQQAAVRGSIINRGLNVVILGKPNAGKSSLLNALAGREQAIVTSQPGTTRDVLRENIEIDGLPLKIIDTAGLRASSDEIEQEGIRRAAHESAFADIVLFIQDNSDPGSNPNPSLAEIHEELTIYNINLPENALLITINNKIDLGNQQPYIKKPAAGNAAHSETVNETGNKTESHTVIGLSAKHKKGLELLISHIKEYFDLNNTTENNFTARRRHLDCIQRALDSLQTGARQLESHQAGELLAEDLRQAQNALGEITGKTIADDLLGEIFSSFCIGK